MGIAAAIFSSVLYETKKEYSVLLKLASVIVISLCSFYVLREKLTELTDLISEHTELPQIISIMLKGVLISVVTSVCSDICIDSGSSSVARAVQLTGRVMMFILSYPLIDTIFTMAVSFAGG